VLWFWRWISSDSFIYWALWFTTPKGYLTSPQLLTLHHNLAGTATHLPSHPIVPPLYIVNPTGLHQANALQLLHANLIAHDICVAAISETWYKSKHYQGITDIHGYKCY